jgi:molybdate transport system substrate-binding protein
MKTDLNVFAAASLKEAFEAIGKDFEAANPGVTVVYNFAGSQQLAQQIGQGAPADVFASPNRAQMDNVIRSGQIVSGAERIFVRNRLVVIYPRENPAELTTLQDLAKPNVKIVFADQAVPVGQYALDFLTKASQLPEFTTAYSATVLKNVVSYEENVRAVLGKVALGEADAGIVYTSDITGDSAQKVGRIDIPDNLNVIAVYPIGPISGSPQTDLAVRYIDYVLSTEGQQILADYGFIPAKP